MIEKTYKKETDGKTYLLLQKTKEAYEEQMIQVVKPNGILPMVKSEQAEVYKYEITGKKTLAMLFERVPMNAEQIRKVLQGIIDILDKGKEYLLSEENFILQPDYIFLRLPEYEVTLCYYPEYKISLVEQMGKLFEMFLNRVDYREETAIAMVYALYMKLQEPDITLERLRKELCNLTKTSAAQTEPVEEKHNYSQNKEETKAVHEVKTEKKIKLWERLRKEVSIRKSESAEGIGITGRELPVSCVMESAPEWNPQYTKVLSVKNKEISPMLVSRRNGEEVRLIKFPFYVGSLPGYMDYVIEKETVSRFHAKLFMKDNRVYLMDLNSTNGTMVNKCGVSVQEQVLLHDGDCIMFAEEEFVYLEK